MKKLVSIRTAVKETGLSEYCIRHMVAAGRVPGTYSGNKFCINLEAFQAMLSQSPADRGESAR